jgi:glycogen operon protein
MTVHKDYRVSEGSRFPRGATVYPEGINFSIISRGATRIELLLYDGAESEEPFQVIKLDPRINRTFIVWHVFVEALPAGVYYTWRADGPQTNGQRFDPRHELVDPWTTAVSDRLWDRWQDGSGHSQRSMRAIAVETQRPGQCGLPARFEESGSNGYRAEEAVIYELHVGGFTLHPSSGIAADRRGTFLGLIDKIPYLQELGVTHVELLPVMAFDEDDVPPSVAARGLRNYWGYSPHSFYSPHPGYCVTPEKGTHVYEFKQLVKALHDAGLDVILDVVINHTAEGGADGPTINFKGLGNEIFYHVDPEHGYCYRDYTGCGNTINANQPMVSAFLLDCLEFWATDVGVDGFRFDLASVLCRGTDGEPLENPPIVWSIELSPLLARKRIIAEAWDAAGLYQVGRFPGYRWSEWNGRYRDVMRRFVRGDRGIIAEVATRIGGSSDYYETTDRHPFSSVNFITCHDGFTLWDLVSYNRKHNENNGEDNRDGHNDNLSWNCGAEGETDDSRIMALRRKQARNFMAVLMLSQGNPMILAGDEVLHSQRGNNNAWCQNNELSWFDWRLTEENADMLRFTREMIALRRRHPSLMRRQFLHGEILPLTGIPDISWYGRTLEAPDWDDPVEQLLAFTLSAVKEDERHLHVIMNMSDLEQPMPLPRLKAVTWRRVVDTALPSPEDIVSPESAKTIAGGNYRVLGRSIVVLEGEWRSTGLTT